MDSEPDLEALRTRVANQAASLAEAVTDGLADYGAGSQALRVELTSPEGPSTGGGIRALQHLRLVRAADGGNPVVFGSVNAQTSRADLRSYDHVSTNYERRFRRRLPVTYEEYEDLLRKSEVVLNLARVKAARLPTPLFASRKEPKRISVAAIVVFVLVLLLSAAVMYRVARTL